MFRFPNTFFVSVSLLLLTQIASADWLDARADSISLHNQQTLQDGTTLNAVEGNRIAISCKSSIGIYGDHSHWEAATTQQWQDHIKVDGNIIGTAIRTINAGTILGTKTTSTGVLGAISSTKRGPRGINFGDPPVHWIATGVGLHEITCVVNEPKGISDHVASNNQAKAVIYVAAKPVEDTPPLTTTATRSAAAAGPATAGALQGPALTQPIGSQPLPAQANPGGSGPGAPPNPCSMEVTYYVPQAPVIEASVSTVEVGDQLRVRCDFEAVTETIEWPVCDNNARNKMASLALSRTSGSRFSGMLTIDGQNMGVTSSPLDLSSFSGEGTMSYSDVGNHEVGCRIDNGLHYVVKDTETYLRQVVSHRIGALTDSERTTGFDPANVVQVATELVKAQIEPLPAGSLAILNSRISGRGSATGSAMPTADELGGGAAGSVVPGTMDADPVAVGETNTRPVTTSSVELVCTSQHLRSTTYTNEYRVSVQNPTPVAVHPGWLTLKMYWMGEDGDTQLLRGLTTPLTSDIQPSQTVQLPKKVIISKQQNVPEANTCRAYLSYSIDQ